MGGALLERQQVLLVYIATLGASLAAGVVVARAGEGVPLALLGVVALAGVVVLTNLPPQVFFVAWLVVAPFLQSSADASALGRTLTWALHIGPALVLLALTLVRRDPSVQVKWVDWLPGAYAAYVLASIALTTDLLQSNLVGTAKAFVLVVAMGPIVYYFLTVGPGSVVRPQRLIEAFLILGIVQGILGVVDVVLGWNLWSFAGWQDKAGGSRAVSTLSNPALLGALLGTAIVIAVAVLVWQGPRSLRRLSWATLLAATPGLVLTLTRGPILATAIAVVVLLLVGRARVVGLAVLAVGAIALVLLLPSFRNTELYEQRVADTVNVQGRAVLQDWSLRLAAQKPVFGWGYGSFDQAKNTSGFYAEGVPIRNVLQYTSHDTYLTVLVELGALGILLLVGPFAVLGLQALARSRIATPDRWLNAACLGSLVVVFLTASTVDFRFFSFAQILPFVFLAILRRTTGTAP